MIGLVFHCLFITGLKLSKWLYQITVLLIDGMFDVFCQTLYYSIFYSILYSVNKIVTRCSSKHVISSYLKQFNWSSFCLIQLDFLRLPPGWLRTFMDIWKRKVYSVSQLLFLLVGLSAPLVSGFIQPLLQSLTLLFVMLPVLSHLSGHLLTL